MIVPIVEGKYTVEKQGGLPVGDYSIAIVEVDPSSLKKSADTEKATYRQKQSIPAKYNSQTQLKATVDGKQNPLTLDFSLAS